MKRQYTKAAILAATCGLLGALAKTAHSAVVTYQLSGSFGGSTWNADGSNATGAGGPVAGFFSVDTDSLTVSEIQISTAFYSLYGPQVMAATYNYGVNGMTDDRMGNLPISNINIARPTFPTYVGLLTDLGGSTDIDGAGAGGNGSIIQVLDSVPAGTFGTRIYRPRLTLWMEGVDFSDTPPQSLSVTVSESVWNVNPGTGNGGYSGAQGANTLTATLVPEPSSIALLTLAAIAIAGRRRRACVN